MNKQRMSPLIVGVRLQKIESSIYQIKSFKTFFGGENCKSNEILRGLSEVPLSFFLKFFYFSLTRYVLLFLIGYLQIFYLWGFSIFNCNLLSALSFVPSFFFSSFNRVFLGCTDLVNRGKRVFEFN
jgi:hypothetical protein